MDIKDIDEIVSQMKQENENRELRPKPLNSFRNNQKNFQYDYEEDFYEPRDFFNDYE